MVNEAQHQSYDNLLKRLLENQSTAILPLLFPELISEVLEELNVEVLIPPRRTDRIYKTRPESLASGQEIMHIEFESSSNDKMDKRLLIYHALLLEKYDLPITSKDDPWVKEKVAEGVLKGKAEEARATLIRFVQRRFPSLTEIARTKAASFTQGEALNDLMEQLWFTSDEYAARALLEDARE